MPIDACVGNDDVASDGMAIITRSGLFGRDHLFAPMRESVLQQDFGRQHHYIATQDTGCAYLPPWRVEAPPPCGVRTSIVQSRKLPEASFSNPLSRINPKTCPYNAFLMDLMEQVSERAWIMIVDDDALLLSPSHVSNIMRHTSRVPNNTVLLQPSLLGSNSSSAAPPHMNGKTIWPMTGWRDRHIAPLGLRIDMANLVFHRSMVRHISLGHMCGADKIIFKQLLAAGGKPLVLNPNETGVGIWANSRGAGRGGTALGHQWRAASGSGVPPEGGEELVNQKLAAALAKGLTDFTIHQMSDMHLSALRRHHYIRVGEHYWQPAEVERGGEMPPATGCTVRDSV